MIYQYSAGCGECMMLEEAIVIVEDNLSGRDWKEKVNLMNVEKSIKNGKEETRHTDGREASVCSDGVDLDLHGKDSIGGRQYLKGDRKSKNWGRREPQTGSIWITREYLKEWI